MIKQSVKKCLTEILREDPDSIICKMKNYDVISFDIFDTLIERRCGEPEEIFEIVERKSGIKGFAGERKIAEKKARHYSRGREITLKKIYMFLDGVNPKDKPRLAHLEIETELLNCGRKQSGFQMYAAAKSEEKKIIFSSDMYLRKSVIETILQNAGYDYGTLYLSSEYGVMKRSGKLFSVIRREFENESIIHIGDDFKSDYLSPRGKGIAACLC